MAYGGSFHLLPLLTLPPHPLSSVVNILHRCTFVTIGELLLAYYHQPSSLFKLGFPLCVIYIVRFCQMYKMMYLPLCYHTDSFHCFKNPSYSICTSLLYDPQPLETTNDFIVSIVCLSKEKILIQIPFYVKWFFFLKDISILNRNGT